MRAAAVLLLATVACSSSATFQGGIYRDERVRYRVGALPPSWKAVRVAGGQVAYLEPSTAATIHANAACGRSDAPLRVLTGHLLIGLSERRLLSQRKIPFDGREALVTHLRGKLDGVPVELEIVVLKKDGCTFDLAYTAHPDRFEARRADFDVFVRGFQKLRQNGERP